MKREFIFLLVAILMTNCSVIGPGQAGIKRTLGKFSKKISVQGVVFYNPLISRVVKESTQTNNIKLFLNLPSKEGLSVKSEISILYRLKKEKLAVILTNLGRDYESIITSVFRSAASDVCARFFAKDMHSGMRANIESDIMEKMKDNLEKQAEGIELIAVLMKSIQLPRGLAMSIERKLQAEQDAMRMKFVLQQSKLEAERKIIEAKGERDAQKILSEGLTEQILKFKTIEAFNKLSNSPNSKIIFTDGKTPLLIGDGKNKE